MPQRKPNVTYSQRPNRAARSAHARGDAMFRTYDTSYIQPKRSKGPVIGVIVVIIVLVLVLGFAVTQLFSCTSSGATSVAGSSSDKTTFVISEGEGASAVADDLVKKGLLSNSTAFTNVVNDKNAGGSLKPGTYTIVGGTTISDLVDQFVEGPGMGDSVTIPEGFTLAQIAAAVDDATQGSISAEDFLSATSNASRYAGAFPFLAEAGENSLEGFLFAKTYSVYQGITVDVLVRTMLQQYQVETSKLDYSFAKENGLNAYQTLNLASIIEREATADTRERVSAVFYNRLNNEGEAPTYGLLQSDATTAYEVGHEPTPEEIHADTPYSTYSNPGLPPTPICSPSIEALKAACNPDRATINDGYYFFVYNTDDKGKVTCVFSKELDEHIDAIE